ncbi:MAG: anthranilate phosphoribosyltransferase [Legionellales bacterium]|nr:anthranilate phosphoribosyltransferase [Legionellales bacterium]
MDIKEAIHQLVNRNNLTDDQMTQIMQQMMCGQVTPAQMAGLLVALRMKGETVTEIAACAKVMRTLAIPVVVQHPHLVDLVGTGGDAHNTFNISTASTFVVAAAGGVVAKHGNRSVSSQSGSADVLQAAGIHIELSAQQVMTCIEKLGIGFLFAPMHHQAMRHAILPRKQLGLRTIFNLLGPLTNPAKVTQYVLGVYASQWLMPMAQVLHQLGATHALVVHAEDGMDEISLQTSTQVVELVKGKFESYTIEPEDFAIARQDLRTIQVCNSQQSLQLVQQALANETGAARDIVALNAGAGIFVAGLADTLIEGVRVARDVLASGAARTKFEALRDLTRSF